MGRTRRRRFTPGAFAIAILASLLLPQAVSVATNLDHLSISAPLQRAGEAETWRVGFRTPQGGDLSGYATQVVFPAGFTVPSEASCSVDDSGGASISVNGLTVKCTIQSGSWGAQSDIVTRISNILAPTTAQTSGGFLVQFLNPFGVVLAEKSGVTVQIHPNVFLAASLDGADERAGQTSAWTLAFTTKNAVAALGDVRLLFPAGFDVVSDATCSIPGLAGLTLTRVSATEAICNLGSANLGALQTYALTISNVRNPASSKNPASTFLTLQTRDAHDALHDQLSNVGVSVEPHPFMEPASVASDSNMAGDSTTFTFTFKVYNEWPADGAFRATFPQGYRLEAGSSSVELVSGADGGFAAATLENRTITASRVDASATPSGATIRVRVSNVALPTRAPDVQGVLLETLTPLWDEIQDFDVPELPPLFQPSPTPTCDCDPPTTSPTRSQATTSRTNGPTLSGTSPTRPADSGGPEGGDGGGEEPGAGDASPPSPLSVSSVGGWPVVGSILGVVALVAVGGSGFMAWRRAQTRRLRRDGIERRRLQR